MADQPASFKQLVNELVTQIPQGRIMTYGQIAALCGSPRSARQVGGLAHFGDPNLPWQRVVNKQGRLASGYPGGRSGHKMALEADGVNVSKDFYVKVRDLIWWPDEL